MANTMFLWRPSATLARPEADPEGPRPIELAKTFNRGGFLFEMAAICVMSV